MMRQWNYHSCLLWKYEETEQPYVSCITLCTRIWILKVLQLHQDQSPDSQDSAIAISYSSPTVVLLITRIHSFLEQFLCGIPSLKSCWPTVPHFLFLNMPLCISLIHVSYTLMFSLFMLHLFCIVRHMLVLACMWLLMYLLHYAGIL